MNEPTLHQILKELRSLREEVYRYRALGFSNGVDAWRQRLYVGQPDGDEGATALYSWNALAKQAVPVPYEFLTGYITGLKLDDSRSYRGKPNVKLLIQVDADSKYEISSGVNNLFSRSFIWAIYNAPLEKFKEPVTLQFRPKPDAETEEYAGSVWCNVSQGKTRLNADYPKKGNRTDSELTTFWDQIFNKAMAKFSKLNQAPVEAGTIVPQVASPDRFDSTAEDPQRNLKRLRSLVKELGLSKKDGDQLIKQALSDRYPGRKSSELIEPEVLSIRRTVLINYGRLQLPNGYETITSSEFMQLEGALGAEDEPVSDSELAQAWLEVLAGLIASANQKDKLAKNDREINLAEAL